MLERARDCCAMAEHAEKFTGRYRIILEEKLVETDQMDDRYEVD